MILTYPTGATPLDPDEINGLIPTHVTTQKLLNEWEQENILAGERWVKKRKLIFEKIMTIAFLKKLHLIMFNKTWTWAGKFRQSNKNIGVDWLDISMNLKLLLDDLHYQIHHETYSIDEMATRFHHRLVSIHPFPNGNGRHARLMTDALLLSCDSKPFLWGNTPSFAAQSNIRQEYIAALRAADQRDYSLLLDFLKRDI